LAKSRTADSAGDASERVRDRHQLHQRELARLQIARQIAALRERAGLSQAKLADLIGTKQAGVARMERQDYQGYTVVTLAKIASAIGGRLELRLAPPARTGKRLAAMTSKRNVG